MDQNTICFSEIGNNHLRLVRNDNLTYTILHTRRAEMVYTIDYADCDREKAITDYNSLFDSVKDMVDKYGNGVIFFRKDQDE